MNWLHSVKSRLPGWRRWFALVDRVVALRWYIAHGDGIESDVRSYSEHASLGRRWASEYQLRRLLERLDFELTWAWVWWAR